MKQFLDENFLLENKTAERLYHEFAAPLPIIDYHCHLPIAEIARDAQFANLTQVWLNGDHYKWRAMRANGVGESFITGKKSDWEKFETWADTVPYTLRNPLFHWTHLELQRYFGIHEILTPANARSIYDRCTEMLASPEFSVHGLLQKMNVESVCTTDDPVDDLREHARLAESDFPVQVLPAFRPDAAINIEDPTIFGKWLGRLSSAYGQPIEGFSDFLSALQNRHAYFAANGCLLSDHGLEHLYAGDCREEAASRTFETLLRGETVEQTERHLFKAFLLTRFAQWDHAKGWVQQFHVGALRNNNSRMLQQSGADTGWDSIGDFQQGSMLSKFLNGLDRTNQLAKTILYNLNPADNELMATMTGNFNDGTIAGKVQWGAAWWFLDQKDGIERQLNALSNMGLLSRFVGMITDSRSFLSYPRHEYFRRILCNILGREIENGELPNDIDWTGKIVADICYHNAKEYFNFPVKKAALAQPGLQA